MPPIVNNMAVHILSSRADVAIAAADLVTDYIASNEHPALGLVGGSTPADLYRELTTRDIAWEKVVCWLGDERWVSVDDPDSNSAMARRLLTDEVGVGFIGPDTSLPTPQEAAEIYTRQLASPGLVLLGIGDDGHTASLFPGTDALREQADVYLANWVEHKETWRLTASFAMLRRAEHIVFLVAGGAKAERIHEILNLNISHPAQRVAAQAKKVTWMLDTEAASLLSSPPPG